MITENIKIGNKIIGRVCIETSQGKHEEIDMWLNKTLIRIALGSECRVIHCEME